MNFARLSRNWAAAFSIANIATLWILFGGAFIIATAGKSKELEINGQIRDREVRLIGADGEQKGVVSIQVAMRAAEDAGLDLVKIAPQAVPPVCKVLDYGKYRFEQQKKEKEAKKNQKVVEVKETRLSLNIDTNDFNTKVNQAAKFLQQGHKLIVNKNRVAPVLALELPDVEVLAQRLVPVFRIGICFDCHCSAHFFLF